MRGPVVLALSLAVAASIGCSRKPADLTPEGALREFLERMDHVDGDPAHARSAYDLLAESTRANLAERARRASAATGRPVPPEEMIAPSRFALRFRPRQMHAHVVGPRALVEVTGIDPDTERAEVPLVLEDGRWRVELVLPALAPVERRPDAGAAR